MEFNEIEITKSNLLGLLFVAYFVTFLVVAIPGFILGLKFRRLLKSDHHDVWIRLGSPSFLNQSILNQWRANVFFWKKEYLQLKDDELTHIRAKIRILSLVGLPVILAWLLLLTLMIVIG